MYKIWFMVIMVFIVSNTFKVIWKLLMEDGELITTKAKLFVGGFTIIMTALTQIPILYWSYMWLWYAPIQP